MSFTALPCPHSEHSGTAAKIGPVVVRREDDASVCRRGSLARRPEEERSECPSNGDVKWSVTVGEAPSNGEEKIDDVKRSETDHAVWIGDEGKISEAA